MTKLERIGHCLDGTLGLDSFTFAAYQWGLDTLQFASNNQIGPELVSLHSSCMAKYSTDSEGQFEVRHAASGLGLVHHRCCMLHPQSGPGLADFARAEQPCRVCRTRQSSACTLGLCNGWWNSSQEGWLHRRLCQCDPVLPTLNCNCLPGSSHCRGEPESLEGYESDGEYDDLPERVACVCVCVCLCVCARARARVCVCVCLQ